MEQKDIPCAKWTVFSVSLIFSLLGLALLVGGTVILFTYKHHEHFNAAQTRSVPMIFIYIGSFAFVFALLGACGAITKSACLNYFASIVFFLLLMIQMGLLIFGSLKQNDMNTFWNNSFDDMLENHNAHKETWDFMQNQLECCGVNSPSDWVNVNNSTDLPASCCPASNDNKCTETVAHKLGCKHELLNFFENHSWILFGAITAIVLIQMLLFGLSCSLYGVYQRGAENYYTEELTSF
ncbi:leukocyte surface antigen CD53-like isoform X2 [Sitodiplosis mosellana]|nr:leukocyte surface antigen CD53-like isoform X2 [Sitodiplosis mosellana]XP_055296810.1 leukocyte surface antigen CD53-like isoform X2 [Sitodiplosis mosellana]